MTALSSPLIPRAIALAVVATALNALAVAQQPSPNADAQRDAMHRLAFMVGHWSGPVTIARGPGEPLKLMQAEKVEYKLDGLVLLIEGQSTGPDGKAQFQALATVAYDEATHAYRIRAHNGGHYVDTEFKVQADGFSWAFETGPATIKNIMHLTAKGQWQETTDVTFANNPPHRSVEMLLERQQ